MPTAIIDLKTPDELLDEIIILRAALEKIRRKQKLDACAAASMQAIAKAALSHPNGERDSGY